MGVHLRFPNDASTLQTYNFDAINFVNLFRYSNFLADEKARNSENATDRCNRQVLEDFSTLSNVSALGLDVFGLAYELPGVLQTRRNTAGGTWSLRTCLNTSAVMEGHYLEVIHEPVPFIGVLFSGSASPGNFVNASVVANGTYSQTRLFDIKGQSGTRIVSVTFRGQPLNQIVSFYRISLVNAFCYSETIPRTTTTTTTTTSSKIVTVSSISYEVFVV